MLRSQAFSTSITAKGGSHFPGWTQMGLTGRLRSMPMDTVVAKCRFDRERAYRSFPFTAITCECDSPMNLRPSSNLITRLHLRESSPRMRIQNFCVWLNTSDRIRQLRSSAENRTTKIGIGAQIALGPLPHHPACGSALGGSSLRSKFDPDIFQSNQSQLLEVSQRQGHVNDFAR